MDILKDIYDAEAFRRDDENDDRGFYAADRFVSHLDRRALDGVEAVVDQLVVEERPDVLDLMASWDLHLPEGLNPTSVTGLGLNANELSQNGALTDRVIHDLNADPQLPFAEASFDIVLNVVSVDYLTRPFEVFAEVARVLRPGGLFLVVFSTRMFPTKAVRIWREADERSNRLIIVEDYFRTSGDFKAPETFIWRGRPRPEDDPYILQTRICDPIFALFAERTGGDPKRPARPFPVVPWPRPWDEAEVAKRSTETKETLACPHCGERLSAWEAPEGPFAEWEQALYHVCFNDACPYLVNGWDAFARQGNPGYSCRILFDRIRDAFRPIPVNGLSALRSGIRSEAERATVE